MRAHVSAGSDAHRLRAVGTAPAGMAVAVAAEAVTLATAVVQGVHAGEVARFVAHRLLRRAVHRLCKAHPWTRQRHGYLDVRVSQGISGYHRVSTGYPQGISGYHRVSQGVSGFLRVSKGNICNRYCTWLPMGRRSDVASDTRCWCSYRNRDASTCLLNSVCCITAAGTLWMVYGAIAVTKAQLCRWWHGSTTLPSKDTAALFTRWYCRGARISLQS